MIDRNNDGKIDASEYADYRRTHNDEYDSSGGADVGFFLMIIITVGLAILWMFSPLLPYLVDFIEFLTDIL